MKLPSGSNLATWIGGLLALALVIGWIVQASLGHTVDSTYVAIASAAIGHFLSGANALSTASTTTAVMQAGANVAAPQSSSTPPAPSATVKVLPTETASSEPAS